MGESGSWVGSDRRLSCPIGLEATSQTLEFRKMTCRGMVGNIHQLPLLPKSHPL